MTIWYEAKPKPLDLPHDGEPVAYFLNEDEAEKYSVKLWQHLAETPEKIENPSHLEFLVKDGPKKVASFKYELHAVKYNHEKLNGEGTIEPNPQ